MQYENVAYQSINIILSIAQVISLIIYKVDHCCINFDEVILILSPICNTNKSKPIKKTNFLKLGMYMNILKSFLIKKKALFLYRLHGKLGLVIVSASKA